jgi:hypothetical protein
MSENETTAPAAPEAPAAPAAPKDIKNGVTRPKDGTKTGRVWGIADEKSTALGAPVPRKDVIEAGTAEGINAATIATQYGRWRKYHGLKSEPRAPKAEAPAAPAAPDTTVG